tara:strand:- start:4514 stop:5590 length:1077 start_codon:yes stop_codon:yes gene_type:complete
MSSKERLYFLDALRAFAILMMLQGHFISGILAPEFKLEESLFYDFWFYCRGFTAPVFFLVTGWVVMFLLLRNKVQGFKNPRIKKGIRRGLELIIWGYVLRLNLPLLLNGELNASFFKPDVLQIIGLGLIFVVGIYTLLSFLKKGLLFVFLGFGCLVFVCEPIYANKTFYTLPYFLSAYLTKVNGGVFYLFPWIGYVSMGASIAITFGSKTKKLILKSIGFTVSGILLIFKSSALFIWIYNQTDLYLFRQVAYNNFLFIRLGDVFVLLGVFIIMNCLFKRSFWVWMGQKTLSIYIIHYFIFYGSLSGIGIYKYFKYSGSLVQSSVGALFFVIICLLLSVLIHRYKSELFLILWRKLKFK